MKRPQQTVQPSLSNQVPASQLNIRASVNEKSAARPYPDVPACSSKQSQVIALLTSASGATLIDLMALTGWQPHTVRGMISGSLRSRLGLDVRSHLVDGERVYRIMQEAEQ